MYIGSDKTTLSVGNISSTNYTDVGLIVGFNEIKLSELLSITNTAMKRTRALDSFYSFSIAYKGDFTINKPSTGHAALLDNTGYNSTITSMIPCIAKNNQAVSYSRYLADTAAVLQVTTKLYEDSTMVFQMDDADVCMDITRKALNTLKDYATIKHREINYGNPDNVTKTINTSFNQLNMGGAHSCTINISHLSIPANDSLVTKNPGNFQYQLIHPQSGNLTYDLSIYAVYNDTVKHFSYSGIPLSGTTSHTIDPYFNGTQPAVIIDNGLNNINDDTLFVNQSPLEEMMHLKTAMG